MTFNLTTKKSQISFNITVKKKKQDQASIQTKYQKAIGMQET